MRDITSKETSRVGVHVNMYCARKAHVCSECKREIEQGEVYENVRGKWGESSTKSKFMTNKSCSDCMSVRENILGEEFSYGDVWRDLWDRVDQERVFQYQFKKLSIRARERATEMVRSM